MDQPTLNNSNDFFHFIWKYGNYLVYESICNRTYTDVEQITFVKHCMEDDGKYKTALDMIDMKLTLYKQICNSDPSQFPTDLKLTH